MSNKMILRKLLVLFSVLLAAGGCRASNNPVGPFTVTPITTEMVVTREAATPVTAAEPTLAPPATESPVAPAPAPPSTESPAAPALATPSLLTPGAAAGCTNRVTYVSDMGMPDNTVLPAGLSFVKTWRLRNSGTCTWGAGYALVFAGGEQMGGAASNPVPVTPPDAEVDLSVSLTAPAAKGTYQGRWQLRASDGQVFALGQNSDTPFWVQIVVP